MAKINYKALGILAVCAVVYFTINGGEGNQSEPKGVYDNAPSDEKSFISVVSNAQNEAKKAANDMQIGGIKSVRDSSICDFLKRKEINRWQGIVEDVTSNSDGKGVFSVKVSDNVFIKTWNNAFSDIGDETLIEPGTALFQAASNLKQGDVVVFSGSFFSDNASCIKESSLSLRGKVEEPEFIFKFKQIDKL